MRDSFVQAIVYTPSVMRVERGVQAAPMQSQVNWALLGLVIERPSYAYELARRFERTYEGVLTLSSVSHAYTALAALRDRALIEELPGTREGRQPKPHYRATPKGLEEYGQWLVGQLDEGLRRQRLFVLALATFTREPRSALEILDRYERACLMEAQNTPIPPRAPAVVGGPELAARLAAEEGRLALGAKLAWVEYARRELSALSGSATL
jgi:DNA-binding PadR family transcriptional regulator